MFDALLFQNDPLSFLKEHYPPHYFHKLGIPEYALPKTHSSLPKKPGFQEQKSLLKQWVYKAFLFRYEKTIPPPATVVLFTWVIPDGVGDLVTQYETATLLKEAFPHLDLRLITLLEESVLTYPTYDLVPQTVIRFRAKERAFLPPSLVALLRESALLLQISTYYPYWKEIEKELSPKTEVVSVGEYGFLDSDHFHPQTDNICMGLHALEKGILLPKTAPAIEASSAHYYAYLSSERGCAVYLHTILQREKDFTKDIELTASPPLPFLLALQNSSWRGYSLKEILVDDEVHGTKISLAEEGKRLIIHVKSFISRENMQKLLAKKGSIVGCRGNRSFSEAVHTDVFYFHESRKHLLPFLHDLYDLALHYLFGYPTLHAYLKCFLDTKTEPHILGSSIADLLQYPATWQGMKQLNKHIKQHFCFNETLKQLVVSKLSPDKAKKEALLLSFLEGEISLETLLK